MDRGGVAPAIAAGVSSMRSFANRPSRPDRFRSPLKQRRVTSRPGRRLNASGQARVTAYGHLARRLAGQFARRHYRVLPDDELLAEALYGLTYAAGLYDETY